jgi:hypothetical protein
MSTTVDVSFAPPTAIGFSDESEYLGEQLQEVQDARASSEYWSGALDEALENLADIKRQCSKPKWDGYNAEPISAETLARLVAFLRAMPENIPTPDLVPEPDGEVSVEWQVSPRRFFSVSVGPHARLAYAGMLGATRWHGVEFFYGGLPQEIIRGVLKIWR